jgi:hypothetical protein
MMAVLWAFECWALALVLESLSPTLMLAQKFRPVCQLLEKR